MRDFNENVNRYGSNCIKYDLVEIEGRPEGTIPMWVADMDFKVPEEVEEAVKKVAERGIYGYSFCPDSYYEAAKKWFHKRWGLDFNKEDVVTTPGVVTAVAAAVRAFTEPGDAVMIQRPVYYPFGMMIERNGRREVNSPLMDVDGRYVMNLTDFEEKLVAENVKLFILCNPHNPVGRVWTYAELRALADICKKHNVTVFSDEIHGDFVFDGREQCPFVNVREDGRDFVVTATAPSKTFNLAGLQTSNIIIYNEELRKKFKDELDSFSVGMIGPMGAAGCEAAYTYGEAWLEELRKTIVKNRDYMMKFIEDRIPELYMYELEGTYLAWVDMSGLAMDNDEIKAFMKDDVKIWVDDGDMFGPEGNCFARFNLACTMDTMVKAMEALEAAVLKKYR